MTRWLAGAAVARSIGSPCVAVARTSRPKVNEVRDFTRAKLDHSQKVLEGLTVEDLNLVAKNSQVMSLLSQAATWQVLQTPEYARRSQDFRQIADRLTDAAQKKNLEGAALAYVELAMKCIDCHKYVRSVRMAKLKLPTD